MHHNKKNNTVRVLGLLTALIASPAHAQLSVYCACSLSSLTMIPAEVAKAATSK
ncbi:MAG: hypothetical protein ACI9BO_002462 [Zhongshania sp.]|jgi:hypothetical protein